MKKFILFIIPSTLILMTLLVGCGSNKTPPAEATTIEPATATRESATSTITATPDLCAPGNIGTPVEKVHKHIREFDDAANLLTADLASGIQRDQVSRAIANLQKIRREAEDEIIPPCLTVLKTYQIQHMNSGINTFIAIMSAKDQQAIDQSLAIAAIARQQHDQYLQELNRLLGITPIPATIITPSDTPTPTP